MPDLSDLSDLANTLSVSETLRNGPPARNFFHVGPVETTFPGDPEEAREHFRLYRAIHIRNLLAPSILAAVMHACDQSPFVADQNSPGFREVEVSPQRAGRILNLILDRTSLLRWLESVSGCDPILSIEGRVTQILKRPGDELTWHDDIVGKQGRRLALVLNLGTAAYSGGDFALRRKGEDILFEHHYSELNSAMIFLVKPDLEHRVTPLTSGGPRRVFAGWAFRRYAGGLADAKATAS